LLVARGLGELSSAGELISDAPDPVHATEL
jgi:hypothetical protein